MAASPCPFCGAALTPTCRLSGDPVGYAHPASRDCILDGWQIGAHLIGRYNRRVTSQSVASPTAQSATSLSMVLRRDDKGADYPTFNTSGEGQRVDVEMINQTVIYYKGIADV